MKKLNLEEILNGKDEIFIEVPSKPIHINQLDKNICSSGKNIYITINDAVKATNLMKKIHHKTYKWYQCYECGYYHLTTQKNNDNKRN